MSDNAIAVIPQFRDAMTDCRRLYLSSAHLCLEHARDVVEQSRQDFLRRMIDLHKGLIIKIYVSIAEADLRWSKDEQQLARELIDHIWQQRLHGNQLKQASERMFADARDLKWAALVRPFEEFAPLRERVADLETVIMRLGNLVAKADGEVSSGEANTLRMIQQEIDIQLKRLSLDGPKEHEREREQSAKAVQIVHQDAKDVRQRCELPSSNTTDSEEQLDVASESTGEQGISQALQELDHLIGLGNVKREVRTLTNFLRMQQHRKAAGLPQQALNLHMVFKGNPGTGKTTVARIVAKILHLLGILKRGHLVETDRSGLVAEYAGQTGPKTNRRIDEALDGVLFIDEAYSLVSAGQEDAFGNEAVQALIKRMEDDRERLVIILAGYPEPMDTLLKSNPGMSSRFNVQMTFEDYQPPELARIYQCMCEANHYVLTSESRVRLLVGFHHAYHERDEHFGNGRLVRNVFELSVRRLANRIAEIAPITHELLTTLTAEDIDFDRLPKSIWQVLQDDAFRIQIDCPDCAKQIRLKPVYLGKRIKCPHCRKAVEATWGECLCKPQTDQ